VARPWFRVSVDRADQPILDLLELITPQIDLPRGCGDLTPLFLMVEGVGPRCCAGLPGTRTYSAPTR